MGGGTGALLQEDPQRLGVAFCAVAVVRILLLKLCCLPEHLGDMGCCGLDDFRAAVCVLSALSSDVGFVEVG
jgi:hypothetical protein